MQGLAATESAMIRSAEIAAEKGDFDGAKGWLAAAAKVRPEMSTVPDAVVRIERLRSARIARLRDLGVAALGQPEGIATARRRLADILLIAKPGHPIAADLPERIVLNRKNTPPNSSHSFPTRLPTSAVNNHKHTN